MDVQTKYIHRNITDYAKELLGSFPAVIIQGARQVGKSTFAEHLVENSAEKLILSFDKKETRQAFDADRNLFVSQADKGILVLDEIQRMPEAMLSIKANIDSARRPGKFILTGSSDLLAIEDIPESLAGRAATIELGGFSQGELQGYKEDFFLWIRDEKPPLAFLTSNYSREDYISIFSKSQYPELQNFSSRMRKAWFSNYLTRILEKDIKHINKRISSERLKAVFNLLAANQAGEMVKDRFAKQLAISPQTFSDYYSILKTMYLVSDMPSWSNNLTTRQVSRKKASVTDSGLALFASKTTNQQLTDLIRPTMLGAITEGFVVSELLKQQSWSEQPFELYHYRDRLGNEVDCVIEFEDGQVILIEVKASTTHSADHFDGIAYLAKKLKSRFEAGFVLNMAPNTYQFSKNMWGIPLSTLWTHASKAD